MACSGICSAADVALRSKCTASPASAAASAALAGGAAAAPPPESFATAHAALAVPRALSRPA